MSAIFLVISVFLMGIFINSYMTESMAMSILHFMRWFSIGNTTLMHFAIAIGILALYIDAKQNKRNIKQCIANELKENCGSYSAIFCLVWWILGIILPISPLTTVILGIISGLFLFFWVVTYEEKQEE